MHVKSEFGKSDNFRCCGCFHVRTGTIILGIWHLVVHLLALGLLFIVLIHFDARNRITTWTTSATPNDVKELLTSEYYSPQLPAANYALGHDKHMLKDVHVGLASNVCAGVITLFLLYGTIRGKPNFLMPFFSLQVFDFIISALTAVGYFSSVPDVRRMLVEASDFPLRTELLRLNPEWLCAILILVIVFCMMLKAYCMGIVWACYKYLKLLHVAHVVGSYMETDNEALLPPDYDTATKMPPHAAMYAPPPYAADFHRV